MSEAQRTEKVSEERSSSSADQSETQSSEEDLVSSEVKEAKEEPLTDNLTVSSADIIEKQTMKWWNCGMIMIAETISLGILSLPSVLANVGLIPGLILLVGLGAMAFYSGYLIHQFRQAYPLTDSMPDALEVLFGAIGLGKFGKYLGGFAFVTFLVFCMASHILTWIICMNTLTEHATCKIVWGAIGMVMFWLLDIPRTFKKMSQFSIASFASITVAVIITMVAVGIEKPGNLQYSLWPKPDLQFREAFLSVTNILFAYGGHVAFFGFISELKDPKDFPKSLALLQICDITMYIVVALVVYCYAGVNVKSPALSSAGVLVSKIAYGIAIPTIVIAGVIFGQVASKYIFCLIFPNARDQESRDFRFTKYWLSITACLWILAFVIAESIPVFNELLGLVSSMFASWFTYGVPGVFWLFLNKGKWFHGWKNSLLTIVNFTLFVSGAAICVIGIYASAKSIAENKNGVSWSC